VAELRDEPDPADDPRRVGEPHPEDQPGAVEEPAERPVSEELEPAAEAPRRGYGPQGMVPGRERRRTAVERVFVRLVATGGIVGIGTALGAILVGQDVSGWIVGLVVALVSVILAAVLWSSRQL
jgi:hypothetical protein